MVDKSIALLADNSELSDDFKSNIENINTVIYKNVDNLRKENYSLLAIDSSIFDSPDLIQFYLSKIRKKIHELPVLLIIRVNQIEELQLDWFFNDCIIYPFRKGELSLRINRLIWEANDDSDIITIGHLKVDIAEYSVYLSNTKVELTYKEFELLRLFITNRGIVFSRKDLLNKIWGVEYIGGTRTVDVHIRRLRSKLGDEFNSIIETVRNVGYKCKE